MALQIEALREWSVAHQDVFQAFLRRCFSDPRPLLLHSDLIACFEATAEERAQMLAGSPLEAAIKRMQEAVLRLPWAYFALRESAGRWHYLRCHLEAPELKEVPVADYLAFKARLRTGSRNPTGSGFCPLQPALSSP